MRLLMLITPKRKKHQFKSKMQYRVSKMERRKLKSRVRRKRRRNKESKKSMVRVLQLVTRNLMVLFKLRANRVAR
jgi:hypothetical protein